jgi:hypothetical protein
MSEPRAYTVDEMRSMLLDYFRGLVKHWATTDLRRPEFAESVKKSGEVMYRMEGLVHSILVTLDGCSMATPSFDLVPSPHPSDAADHREHGENWWPEKVVINECMLHDLWHVRTKRT